MYILGLDAGGTKTHAAIGDEKGNILAEGYGGAANYQCCGTKMTSVSLTKAIEEAFKNGAEKVWVDPNPNNIKAIALYERLGFVRTQMPGYLTGEDGVTSIYMELIRK